jgi:integrative and conjugative element protein (TIGR02256 family)
MSSDWMEAQGAKANAADLRLSRSRSLADFLHKQLNPHAELIEVRKTSDGKEVLVCEVEVEVSQVRVHDIRPRERLATIFWEMDDQNPEVVSLRRDFPFVPHLNPRGEEFPRSLCLFEETPDELKLTWTPAKFVERIRWWLAETAKGTLHGEDQPLEPILLGNFPPLVLPSDFIEWAGNANAPRPLDIELRRAGSREVYVAAPGSPQTGYAAIGFIAQPHLHGVIRLHPGNLKRLNEILKDVGLDLLVELRKRLEQWQLPANLVSAPPILVVFLPKQRNAGVEAESLETWAFLLTKTIGELGVALGLLQRHDTAYGRLLGGQPDEKSIEETGIFILNPTFPLSRERAAILNATLPNTMKITAIGLGAIGSQIIDNLVRAGFGIWTGVDHDFVLPHNVARHQLTQAATGWLKAQGMQSHVNSILDEPAMPAILEADVLHPGTREAELLTALAGAEAILDLSANLPVARRLAYYPENKARRCSVFLNPSGSDLVLLCEDKNRRARLDWLEFQYYRELLNNSALHSHFVSESGIRYGRSCGDLTSRIPQHLIAMHSGIGARALQHCLSRPEAAVRIWHSDPSMSVQAHNVEAAPVVDLEIGGWRVCTDEVLANRLKKWRKAKLPRETGGVLIGTFDQENRIAYLVDIIPSPPDSTEWPTLYIRGTHGLEVAVNGVRERAGNQLQYVGEWHSHPDGYGTEPSRDDKQVFRWLTEFTARDSHPPVMVIVGQKEIRIFLGSIEDWALLKRRK